PARAALRIPFSVRPNGAKLVDLQVRVDGRPATDAYTVMQPEADGRIRGEALVPLPVAAAGIQLLARSSQGVSEPLGVAVPARLQAGLPALAALAKEQPLPAAIALDPAASPVLQGSTKVVAL